MAGVFRFKEFEIEQDRCAMKIGTDGILLGAWANVSDRKRILDVGTGTGLIALMAAQRNGEASLMGIEPDPDAADQARQNMEGSPWAGRLAVENVRLQDWQPDIQYDCILSNPPYFPTGIRSADDRRAAARHMDGLPLQALLRHSERLLDESGMLSLILPIDQRSPLLSLAEADGWKLRRMVEVKPIAHKPPFRILVELGRQVLKEPDFQELTIQSGGANEYSEEFRTLTHPFYLFM
ncbi:methyltransferase [Pontibacter sp. G13]|uniref:tRNA1(Val) (adenine(37)-N6)-methyltransferase n=1 Tax=Pontibacter sp. G13 TaxID=3074898 RepID=UPI00288B8ED8|nr:methyltransferase [Pontibacter sp. G13]WNJ21572.1 methyltransferase [Pontibacter sp. G13]